MSEKLPSPEQPGLRERVIAAIRDHGMNEAAIDLYGAWEQERQEALEAEDPTAGAKIKLELERAQLFRDAGLHEEAESAYEDAATMAFYENLEHLLNK